MHAQHTGMLALWHISIVAVHLAHWSARAHTHMRAPPGVRPRDALGPKVGAALSSLETGSTLARRHSGAYIYTRTHLQRRARAMPSAPRREQHCQASEPRANQAWLPRSECQPLPGQRGGCGSCQFRALGPGRARAQSGAAWTRCPLCVCVRVQAS